MLKKDYQIFSTNLKSRPYINKISLSKGSVEIYLDDNDIEYLIKYYDIVLTLCILQVIHACLSCTGPVCYM